MPVEAALDADRRCLSAGLPVELNAQFELAPSSSTPLSAPLLPGRSTPQQTSTMALRFTPATAAKAAAKAPVAKANKFMVWQPTNNK